MAHPQLIAHRGLPRELPENTLPGFARALELGADGIELDVHATADGTVVVHHDPVPRATATRAALAGRPIASLSLAEIRTFRVAGTTPIPTLAEVLEVVGARATVYVEVKGLGIEREVLRVIGEARATCAVHSFDHETVRRVGELAPAIPTGALVTRRPADAGALLRALRARDLWPEWPIIDEGTVRSTHAVGGRVIAWTVNDPGAAAHLLAIGVDGICTDFTGRMADTVRGRE